MMPEMLIRLAILLLASLLIWLLVWLGQRFVAERRQSVLAATPPVALLPADSQSGQGSARVHILAFSSEDCHQCRRLQSPALRRVLAACGEAIRITEIDAPTETALAQHYHVLTVPTTVLLDATGKAQAVNYGFTNAERLLTQIDEILALQQEPVL